MRSCPRWLLLAFVITISTNLDRMMATKTLKREQNIGTVLFERSDSHKHCWTTEDFIILNSRRMFQDILPKAQAINFENDRHIALLMDYFHICLESVRKMSKGKTKHLMLKALADTMGGYLRVYILPITRQSYYAGNIKYRNAKRLFELYEELKIFLRSNGAGWMKPSKETKHAKIPPIVITPPKTPAVACDGLITYSTLPADHQVGAFQHFTSNKRKRFASPQGDFRNDDARLKYRYRRGSDAVLVPLPFFDDEIQPNSIALPYKKDSLQSLYSEKSAFALVKYYVASVKCIISKTKTKKDLQTFNMDFFKWLLQSVRRHLEDEKWYPAFGGVLRVITTLEESGVGIGSTAGKQSGTYQMMPKIGTDHTPEPDDGVPPLYKGNGENDEGFTLGTTEIISIAVVSALLIWVLVGLCLVCYRYFTKYSDVCSPCNSQTPPVAVLYENMDYYEPETCPSKLCRKGLLERFKDWWRYKFGKCPGGCQDQYADEERCLAAINYSSKDTVDGSFTSKMLVGGQKKKFSKSVTASPSDTSKNRAIFRKTSYTSDGSTTNSEKLVKKR